MASVQTCPAHIGQSGQSAGFAGLAVWLFIVNSSVDGNPIRLRQLPFGASSSPCCENWEGPATTCAAIPHYYTRPFTPHIPGMITLSLMDYFLLWLYNFHRRCGCCCRCCPCSLLLQTCCCCCPCCCPLLLPCCCCCCHAAAATPAAAPCFCCHCHHSCQYCCPHCCCYCPLPLLLLLPVATVDAAAASASLIFLLRLQLLFLLLGIMMSCNSGCRNVVAAFVQFCRSSGCWSCWRISCWCSLSQITASVAPNDDNDIVFVVGVVVVVDDDDDDDIFLQLLRYLWYSWSCW